MTKTFALAATFAAFLALGATGAASAQINSPVGLWTLSFFVDNSPAMPGPVTQGLCFRPDGTWFSTTFGGWGGSWFQKGSNGAGNGNRVRILGNFDSGAGNDSAEVDFVNLQLMAGAWTEWRDGFGFINWTRVSLTFQSSNCGPNANAVKKPEPGANPSAKR